MDELADRVGSVEGGIEQLGVRIGDLDRTVDLRVASVGIAIRSLAGALVKKGVFKDMAEVVALSDAWVAETIRAGQEQKRTEGGSSE